MPNMKVKDFGIALKPGTNEATAERLLNGNYKGTLDEMEKGRQNDVDEMLAAGEDWAAMYAMMGFQATSQVGESLTDDEKFISKALYISCGYFTANDERIKLLQDAEKSFDEKKSKLDTFEYQLERVRTVSVMTRMMIQTLPVFPKLDNQVQHVYLNEQSSATRSHSHRSNIFDVKASIVNVQHGLLQVARETVIFNKLIL
jgi:hypothetical protein